MRKSQKINEQTPEELDQLLKRVIRTNSLVGYGAGLLGVVASSLAVFLSIYVSKTKSPKPGAGGGYLTTNFLYFVGGIILFGIMIVAIASISRWKNRDVTNLKVRLSEIYLGALTKSALNPQSHGTSK